MTEEPTKRRPRVALAVLCALGLACNGPSLDEGPTDDSGGGGDDQGTQDAGMDLSGADCEIWIDPGGQREVYLWFSTETKPGTPSPTATQPETLEINLWAKNTAWCIGDVTLPKASKRVLKVEFNADRTLNSVNLGGAEVTRDEDSSKLTHMNPSVFAVDVDSGEFDLHIHYAEVELVIQCDQGPCL